MSSQRLRPKTDSRNKRKRLSLVARGILTMAMCVTLLQLPVPMLHQHDRFESGHGLATHLVRHHSADDHGCAGALENDQSHWHFVTPSELGQESDPEQDAEPPVATFVGPGLTQVTAIGSLSDLCADPIGTAIIPWGLVCRHDIDGRSLRQNQLGCSVPAVRPCALLCVMRC